MTIVRAKEKINPRFIADHANVIAGDGTTRDAREYMAELGRKSAERLTPEQRKQRGKHAAEVRYKRELRKDEQEAGASISELRLAMHRDALALIAARPTERVQALAVALQKRHRFYLTDKSAAQILMTAVQANDLAARVGRVLKIRKGAKLVGVLNVASLTLETDDAELQQLFAEATGRGMYSLGRMDTPESPDGTIVDAANFTKLVPGDLISLHQFRDEVRSKGYNAKFSN